MIPASLLTAHRVHDGRKRFAFGAKGFRPFFLLAAAFSAAVLPLWLLALTGVIDPGGYFLATYWHAHEMVFGFSVAVVAGFLLTATSNWTRRETARGAPLLALAALWVCGRVAVTLADGLPRGLAAVVDLAFLPVLVVVLARPMIAARSYRNFVMLAVLLALFGANMSTHLDALGFLPGWQRRGTLLGVNVLVFVIVVMAGRVLPMFTRNATGVAAIRSYPLLDGLAAAGVALFTVLDTTLPDHAATALAAGLAGVLVAARSVRWGARHSLRDPLLWSLHVGHAWIAVGLLLRALSALTVAVPASAATHALTVGAIGSMTLGMMARVALGHTGRMLTTPRPIAVAFALVVVATVLRVFAAIAAPSQVGVALVASGVLWSVAFALYAIVFAPILFAPRVDLKDG